MPKKYTVDFFIEKFSKIPEKNWIVGRLRDKSDPNKRCALGHCGMNPNSFKHTLMSLSLKELFKCSSVIDVNDNCTGKYKYFGKTPKTRILKMLKNIRDNELYLNMKKIK